MSERSKPHNGRDTDGHRKVVATDVDDLQADPNGADYLRDDIRLGGAVADTGVEGGLRGKEIERLVADNREDVAKVSGKDKHR